MANLDLPQSPNVFHPEKPSAVGSRNSLAQDYRDQQKEVNQLIEEETNKVLHHLTTKLPKEVLERLDVMGGVKEKLYNYFNQNYQNMFNRYMVTAEDEMLKKVRGFIDREEMKVLDRYTPKEIATLLDAVGGADKFNTGEIEKSIVNMYGHLQGHVQRGVNDLETLTNSLLRQKTDVGAFVRGENAYSIVKCAFKDNLYKPKTVTDVKLSVNILDTELISPIFQYQSTVEYLIKDLLSNHYMDVIDKEIEKIVGFQTDKPFKRSLQPFGGIRMAETSCESYGYKVDDEVVDIFTKYRKTHNQGVFDAYTAEMRAARKSGIITGLPDAYGRGRIIGDYRRVALYGLDYLIEDKKKQLNITVDVMDADEIRLREELSEQIRALQELIQLGEIYGFDLRRPAENAKEAVQW